MFKFVSALVLAAVSIAPAQAATTIIVNAGSTALPAYTTAPIIQNFTNTTATFIAGVQAITPTTNIPFTVGGTRTFSQTAAPVTNGSQGVTTVVPVAGVPAGMDGTYLRIGSNSSYTISFVNNPVAYFSFVFSNLVVNSQITLNFVSGAPEVFGSPSALLGGATTIPSFGRVSYDVGNGPKIQSVEFRKTGGNAPFNVDSIAAAAPEPAAWLMMILGFGLVGSQLRRRRGRATLAAA